MTCMYAIQEYKKRLGHIKIGFEAKQPTHRKFGTHIQFLLFLEPKNEILQTKKL